VATPSQPPARPHRVQVGSFDNKENSQKLAAELHEKGYYTYTRETKKDGKTRFEVQVGAYGDRANAEKVKKELADQGYSSYVASTPD